MRLLFEDDVEGTDYLEIIITTDEFEEIIEKGLVKEIDAGLYGERELNIFIRVSPLGEK